MSTEQSKGLRRLNTDQNMAVMNALSDQDKRELAKDAVERGIKNRIAEDTIATMMDAADQADKERRAWHMQQRVETGSGELNISIRGGDAKLILPILITVGVIVLGIVAIIAWR